MEHLPGQRRIESMGKEERQTVEEWRERGARL